MIDILNRGTPILIIALGMTLVIAKEGIDISVGSVLAIAASLAAFLLQKHVPFALALLAGLGIGVLCGYWNGLLVAKLKIQPMIATLILLTVGRGIAQLISGGKIITISDKAYRFVGGAICLVCLCRHSGCRCFRYFAYCHSENSVWIVPGIRWF